MKNVRFLSVLLFSSAILMSCEKVEKLLFQPFDSTLNIAVPIDILDDTTTEIILGRSTINYNLDQVVKAQTGSKLDGSVINSIYLKKLTIELSNADAQNNLGNFEYISLVLSSGDLAPIVFGPVTITASASNTATFSIENSPNIKEYFTGTNVHFELRGKAHSRTTKMMESIVSASLRYDK